MYDTSLKTLLRYSVSARIRQTAISSKYKKSKSNPLLKTIINYVYNIPQFNSYKREADTKQKTKRFSQQKTVATQHTILLQLQFYNISDFQLVQRSDNFP